MASGNMLNAIINNAHSWFHLLRIQSRPVCLFSLFCFRNQLSQLVGLLVVSLPLSPSQSDPQQFLPASDIFLLPCPKLLLPFLRLCPAEHMGNHTTYFHSSSKYLQFLAPLHFSLCTVWLSHSDTSDNSSVPFGGTTSLAPPPHKSNIRSSTSTGESFHDGIFRSYVPVARFVNPFCRNVQESIGVQLVAQPPV